MVEELRNIEEEYFELERNSEEKYEFHNGEIVAMPSGTKRHSRIAFSVGAFIDRKLQNKNCTIYNSDLTIAVQSKNSYYHPDCTVVCGDTKIDDSIAETNPTVIIEVLSESTEKFDRGEKFHAYQTLDSLQEYVLISQHKPMIEIFTRTESDFWLLRMQSDMNGKIMLNSLQVELDLSEIYRNVVFDEQEQ